MIKPANPIKCPRCGTPTNIGLEERWYIECPVHWIDGCFVAADTLIGALIRWAKLCVSQRKRSRRKTKGESDV